MTSLLGVEELSVVAGGRRVLDRVSIDVQPGEVVAIVGANGAGKTTLLDAISGLVRPSSGRVVFRGEDVTRTPPHQRARRGMTRAFQDSRLYCSLTVPEAVAVACGTMERAGDVVSSLGLGRYETAFVAELSTGTRRLVEVAAAVASRSALLMLDEPTTGVAHAEKRALRGVLRDLVDRTGCALVLVEHDLEFASAIADRVVVLQGGAIVDAAATTSAGHARDDAREQQVEAAIARLEESARPVPVSPPGVSTWTLLRLGLRELAAGALSVLTLGVLNRVMKVELGVELWIAGGIVAAYTLAAPFAVAVGHLSDRRPVAGRHRTPYIVGGALLTAACAALAPSAAYAVASSGSSPATVALACALFAAMGLGMSGSGAAFFALLTDITTEQERGRAISIVYSMLMIGILAGVALSVLVLGSVDRARLDFLFTLIGVTVACLSVAAVWRVERPASRAAAGPPFRAMLGQLAGSRQARGFFGFMSLAIFFAFLQQAVLEPFGGDVLRLSVRATTSFNAVQIVGVLAGMAVAGSRLAPRVGNVRTAATGIVVTAVSFATLALSSGLASPSVAVASIGAMGAGLGLFNVGALALMMDMSVPVAAGMSMGLWTLAHSVADGLATAGGGVLHGIFLAVARSEPAAYAGVFGLECAGMLATLVLLRRVSPARFRGEVSPHA